MIHRHVERSPEARLVLRRPHHRSRFQQAMGLINDHTEGCVIRGKAAVARAASRRPTAIKRT